MSCDPMPAPQQAARQAPQQAAAQPLHDARDLTCGGPSAHIALDGQVYTLRITRAGKLILTK